MDIFSSFLPNFNWYSLLILPGLLVGFTVHELGHSIAAYLLGDTSQVEKGNLTANPFKHVSWLGAILFVLVGIGWPKPLQFDPKHFKDRFLDTLLVSLAGPTANFLTSAIVFSLSLGALAILGVSQQIDGQQLTHIIFFSRSTDPAIFGDGSLWGSPLMWIIAITNRVWVANFALGMVSLIPLPPFDGFTAILSFLGVVRQRRLSALIENDPHPPISPADIIEPKPAPSKKKTIADIHFQKGVEYHQQQKYDDAIARYRLAIQADPSFGPAYVNLGLAHKAKGQTKEAIHALRGATQHASDTLSRNQAWAELHNLNAIPDAPPPQPANSSTGTGTIPWTNTKPTPNWTALGMGMLLLVLTFSCPLIMLLFELASGGH